MKKIISFLLILSLLSPCLIACGKGKEILPIPIPNVNEGEKKIEKSEPVVLDSDSELVVSLTKYLYSLDEKSESIEHPTTKIQNIAGGMQPLLLDYSTDDTYFVCGYYDAGHSGESEQLCCASKYTWVRYEKAEDIRKYYEEKVFMCAFQINDPGSVKDVLTEGGVVPEIAHFMLYQPSFTDGVNTNPDLKFDKIYIYINDSDEGEVYHSTMVESTELNSTLPCLKLDGLYYLYFESSSLRDGVFNKNDMNQVLDWYYYFMLDDNVLDLDGYSVTFDNGDYINYATITVEDFIYELTLENREKDPILLEFLNKMEKEDEEVEKLQFLFRGQVDYYVYKNYYTGPWEDPCIMVFVDCNYDLAVDEDWYKACEQKDTETLNSAFFDAYLEELSREYYVPDRFNIRYGLFFDYEYPMGMHTEIDEIFSSDYIAIRNLAELDWVESIRIYYDYCKRDPYYIP